MIAGRRTFLTVCQQGVNDPMLMKLLKVEMKEPTVMAMMERGVVMNLHTFKKNQIFQQ